MKMLVEKSGRTNHMKIVNKGKQLREAPHTQNARRGEYYHFEFELTRDDKGRFNIFSGGRSMRSGSSLYGVKEWINEWLDETFTEGEDNKLTEEAPLNKYKYYIIDDREIEGNIYAHTAQEARAKVAEKYKINPEEVDIDIFKVSGVGYRS